MDEKKAPPGFPGEELLNWCKHMLARFGTMLVGWWARIRAIPKERWLSTIAILGMLVLVLLLGGLVGAFLLSPLIWGALFGLATLVWLIFSLATANNLKLTLAKAKRADDTHTILLETVKDLSNRAGIPVPSIWISEQEDPNAFVCGRSPKKAALVVHTGGLNSWSKEQLKGVLAHEVAHIRNRDVLAMTIAVSLYESMTWICRVYFLGVLGAIEWAEKAASRTSGLMKLMSYFCWLWGWALFWISYGLLMALILPAGALLRLASSRQQEYLADRGAAELLGSGEALASALLAMDSSNISCNDEEPIDTKDKKKPWKERFRLSGGWANVWSTHPPTAKRIELLRNMVLQQSQSTMEV